MYPNIIIVLILVFSNLGLNAKEEDEVVCRTPEEDICPAFSKDDLTMANAAPKNPNHYVKTLGGILMPKLIYGTAWKKDRTASLVVEAVRAGFRGIDTACQPKHYFEPGVGAALKTLQDDDGILRSDLFIQTKFTSLDGQDPGNVPYDKAAPLDQQVQQALNASLKNLGTSYIDSLVLHSPMKTHGDTMVVWRVFETFVDSGKVKQLGLSNCYSLSKFQELWNAARVKPSVLQNRFYEDSSYDKGLRAFCKENGIYYQSFWTLSANPHVLKSSIMKEISASKHKTPEQLLFGYLIQTGVVTPLTGTTSKLHMKQDLEALDMTLTQEEMTKIGSFFA